MKILFYYKDIWFHYKNTKLYKNFPPKILIKIFDFTIIAIHMPIKSQGRNPIHRLECIPSRWSCFFLSWFYTFVLWSYMRVESINIWLLGGIHWLPYSSDSQLPIVAFDEQKEVFQIYLCQIMLILSIASASLDFVFCRYSENSSV